MSEYTNCLGDCQTLINGETPSRPRATTNPSRRAKFNARNFFLRSIKSSKLAGRRPNWQTKNLERRMYIGVAGDCRITSGSENAG